ncbi:hypothetical protein SMNI109538_16085 [Smaragdicoccus niigatensis]
MERDRDDAGRARNSRARDALGRPLPYGVEGVPRIPDDLTLSPAETLAYAQQLLNDGLAFNAHEVLEAAWKSCPEYERELWQGLAQMAVGITHVQRGNPKGAKTLFERARLRLKSVQGEPHGIDVSGLIAFLDTPGLEHVPRLIRRSWRESFPPGSLELPSGRAAFAGEPEETAITVDIGDGVRAVLDDFGESGPVDVSLHWSRHQLDGPPGTFPYDSEAVVRYVESIPGHLVIEMMPAARHQDDCDACPVDSAPALAVEVAPGAVMDLVDVLAGLPRGRTGYWKIDEGGTALWRGRLDEAGNALIENVPYDDRIWRVDGNAVEFAVVAKVPVLARPKT